VIHSTTKNQVDACCITMKKCFVFSFPSIVLLCLIISSNAAFLLNSPTIDSTTRIKKKTFLSSTKKGETNFDDKYNVHNNNSCISAPTSTKEEMIGQKKTNGSQLPPMNEWGIPNSQSLPPILITAKNSQKKNQLPNGGRISLVGAGPGDPDLLTVSAYRLLTNNDNNGNSCNTITNNNKSNILVISDRLVSKEILDLIPYETKIARKLPGCQNLAQEEIYWWCYQGLQQGKHVVRLKIGDPFVFGRGGEEVLTFRRFGVEPNVIPGVSAAFSAPLLGSIPVTHRGVSNQVVMCTGYGRENTSPDLIQYHKEQTIVFLMAVGRLRKLCQRLISLANYPSKTPVAIIERAGCPQQRVVVGNMETIADIAQKNNIQPPSTIVVGEVVNVLLNNNDNSSNSDGEQDEDNENNTYAIDTIDVTELIQNATSTVSI